ncbi:MAG TPA: dihydropteroate synthase [Candidatus Avamphibacillus intestinigallinarum]|nr:dihydropteroate synthase [Candidatus Avamphibacillus intestinigallinarum]
MYLKTKKQTYDLNARTYIMGILNTTPDSFSDGGRYNSVDRAVEQAVKMEAEGADIIDIGGESTRPGHTPLSAAEELERILPVIEAVEKNVSIPISVDTYKAETAKQVLENGADIINDIWGAKFDPKMAEVVAQYDAPIVLMHNRDNMNYTNLIADMTRDLQESINIARANGIKDEHIILDPGIGLFAKTMQDNLFAMKHLDAFKALGYPILLGTSRKSFIGTILDEPVADNRDIGTGATTCLGISKGCQIVRVHNVKANVALRKMMDAMLQAEEEVRN